MIEMASLHDIDMNNVEAEAVRGAVPAGEYQAIIVDSGDKTPKRPEGCAVRAIGGALRRTRPTSGGGLVAARGTQLVSEADLSTL